MTDIIMVKGRASNNVGRALSKMLEATKPVKAVHGAQAGESVKSPAPAPHNSPELLPLTCSGNGSLPAGGGDCPSQQPPPAPPLVWDREKIRIEYQNGEISEDYAINSLMQAGMDVFSAMEYLDNWS